MKGDVITIAGHNVHDVIGKIGRTSMPMDGNKVMFPVVLEIFNPEEVCVYHHKGQDPFVALNTAILWLRDAQAPLELIAKGLTKEGVPQQLLTIGQSVSLTFMLNDGSIDLMVGYSCRDVFTDALHADFVAFSYGLQLLSRITKIPVGVVYVSLAQAVLSSPSMLTWMTDPYTAGNTPTEIPEDYEEFMSQLSLFLEEGPVHGITDRFVKKMVIPMSATQHVLAGGELTRRRFDDAREQARSIRQTDWRVVALNYITQLEESTIGE